MDRELQQESMDYRGYTLRNSQLNAQLLRMLECPACLETCLPPIYFCANGHVVCATCQEKIDMCGECRHPGRPSQRCLALESMADLLEAPCPNQSLGCQQTVKIGDMNSHLAKCGFKCLLCDEWKASVQEIKGHVLQKHPLAYLEILASVFEISVPVDEKNNCPAFVGMVSLNNDLFWLEYCLSSLTRILCVTLRVLSHDAEDAARYTYGVQRSSTDNEPQLIAFSQADVLTANAPGYGDACIVLPARIVDHRLGDRNGFSVKILVKKVLMETLESLERQMLSLEISMGDLQEPVMQLCQQMTSEDGNMIFSVTISVREQ